jgi:tetratricopeptide (TPR) repeat protein
MSTEQLITILAGVGAIILFALSHRKVAKTWKILLSVLFLAVIIFSTTLNWFYLEKKESKEAEHETKMDQIDTHVRASLSFNGYIEAARMNRQARRTDEAIYDVECALKKDPKSAAALNLLAVLYYDKGDYDSAIETYTKIKKGLADSSITISTREDLYHRNFGEAYMAKNMWTEAKEELQECLCLNDSNLECYFDLARTLNELKEWQELYNLCKNGVAKFPTSAPLCNFLGLACIEMTRLDEGEAALLKAIQADSTFGQPHLFLAIIYFLKKQPKESESFINKALKLNPTLAKDVEILKEKKLLP